MTSQTPQSQSAQKGKIPKLPKDISNKPTPASASSMKTGKPTSSPRKTGLVSKKVPLPLSPKGMASPKETSQTKEQRQRPIPHGKGQDEASGSSVGTPSPLSGPSKVLDSATGKARGVAKEAKQVAPKTPSTQKIPAKGVELPSKGVELPSKGAGLPSKGAGLPSKDVKLPSKEIANGPEKKLKQTVPLDLSMLDGLTVNEDGKVLSEAGEPIGEVVEGDPADLVGQTVNGNGEILDEDGDLIGCVQLLGGKAAEEVPEKVQAVQEGAEEVPEEVEGVQEEVEELPEGAEGVEAPQGAGLGLADLWGLPIDAEGFVKDKTGRVVGRVAEGDPDELAGEVVNEEGEVVDEDGNLIGRVELVSLPEEEEEEEEEGEGEGGEMMEGQVEVPQEEEAADKTAGAGGGIPDIAILQGRTVNDEGKVLSDEGDVIGQLVQGQDAGDLAGKAINEQGEVVDDDNNVIGQVEIVPEEAAKALQEEVPEQEGERPEAPEDRELPDISTLEGLTCNKLGSIVTENGDVVGEVVEGDPKKLWKEGFQLDSQGQFWDRRGNVVGKAQTIALEEEKAGPFANLGDISVADNEGWVRDENGTAVGKVVQGDPKKLVGRAVDDDGDILDKRGNVIGHAEPWEEPEVEPEHVDFSAVEGLKPNKMGNVIGPNQVPIARVVEGDLKEVAGRAVDQDGKIWNDKGQAIGRVELIPESEIEEMGPFSGLGDLVVNDSGFVEDVDGVVVGRVIEGDPKTLRGKAVDDDGEIVDKFGNVKGRAERYEPPEEEEADLSILDGLTVNKLGNVVDTDGAVLGRIVAGNPRKLAGKKVDAKGQIWSDAGRVIGQAECIPEQERERPEGIFSGLDGLTLNKDGNVVDLRGEIVGRLVEGDQQRLAGRAVDEDGEVIDKYGNAIGRTERWKPEEPQRDISPMAGRKVNSEGEVRDEDGNLIGKLTQGNLATVVGKRIDDNGYILDNDGNKVGECTLIENLPEPELSPEELEKQQREEEDRELAKKMCAILSQTLDSVGPLCKQITNHIETANRTPKEELDEEKLVKDVKPLIEEAGNALQECKGALRALDPDGQIAARAKARSASREATPEEYQLADLLKELTQTVVETIEKGRRLIADMPHAKKKINPLWALLSEPLFQIIAAVGLLLSGVLGLVSKLLEGLGLGGILHGLLGALGIDKLLDGLGLGKVTGVLGVDK